MAKAHKFDLEDPAPILDVEDEETLAAIDEGIRGADSGRVVPADNARELLPLHRETRPDIKELLLGPGPRFELVLPKRGTWRLRPPIELDLE